MYLVGSKSGDVPDRVYQIDNSGAVVTLRSNWGRHVVCSQQGSLASCPICC